ncbi:hypothetical protein [Cryobacterium sp. TMT2-14]|uniref:hypothetical protein n=1 Tax=Cryobacterium sp. TMT2-14 TaxID=1259245 RepID=UPI001069668A|nr:hypothetical protein [Cryobacterium sp. TMT2-14]TFC33841.1 hypothetical protein E3O28_13175 [Cryobacterium sp. TMT2-14]
MGMETGRTVAAAGREFGLKEAKLDRLVSLFNSIQDAGEAAATVTQEDHLVWPEISPAPLSAFIVSSSRLVLFCNLVD